MADHPQSVNYSERLARLNEMLARREPIAMVRWWHTAVIVAGSFALGGALVAIGLTWGTFLINRMICQ
jgi:hypothetical protein